MKSIPNLPGFLLMVGIAVAFSSALTAAPGQHLLVLASGLLTAGVLALIVAAIVRLMARRPPDDSI